MNLAIAAKFVKSHWAGLVESGSDAPEEEIDALYDKFVKAKKNVRDALRKMRVPAVAKTAKEDTKVCLW